MSLRFLPVDQEFENSLAGWFWLRMSHKTAVSVVIGAAVILKAVWFGESVCSKLTNLALSMGLPHDMAAGFPRSKWSKESKQTCKKEPSLYNPISGVTFRNFCYHFSFFLYSPLLEVSESNLNLKFCNYTWWQMLPTIFCGVHLAIHRRGKITQGCEYYRERIIEGYFKESLLHMCHLSLFVELVSEEMNWSS